MSLSMSQPSTSVAPLEGDGDTIDNVSLVDPLTLKYSYNDMGAGVADDMTSTTRWVVLFCGAHEMSFGISS
jgi:hypothetical protein